MSLYAGWNHTALSIGVYAGDWSYTFTTRNIVSAFVTGASTPLASYNIRRIQFGLYFIPRSDVTAFAAGVMVAPVVGTGSSATLLPAVASTETVFHIHRLGAKVYFTAGAGITLAQDGITELAGGTLLAAIDTPLGGPARLMAGFESIGSAIEGYAVDGLQTTSTTDTISSSASGTEAVGATSTGALQFPLLAFGAATGVATDVAAGLITFAPLQAQGYAEYITSDLNYGFAGIGPLLVEGMLVDTSVRGLQTISMDVVGVVDLGAQDVSGVVELPALVVSGIASGDPYQIPLLDIYYYGTYSAYDILRGAYDVVEVAYAWTDLRSQSVAALIERVRAAASGVGLRQLEDVLVDTAEVMTAALSAWAVLTASNASGADTVQPALHVITSDSAVASSSHLIALIATAEDAVVAADAAQAYRRLVLELVDAASAGDLARAMYILQLIESADVAATAAGVAVLELLDRAVAADSGLTFYRAVVQLLEAVNAADSAIAAFAVPLAEAVLVQDALRAYLKTAQDIVELVQAAANVETRLTLIATATSSAAVLDDHALSGQYLAELLSKALVTVDLRLPDEGFVGWAMNTEGAMALSQYSNYPFNSFAELNREVYAAAEDGLYLLGGDSDAGTAIDAQIRSLVLAFGTSRQKRLRSAYLGYTASGRLILRLRAVTGGQMVEHWFEARDIGADAPREQRVNLAMGMRSRYWQFELVNVDGADFEVDELELHPLTLQRRV